MFFKVVDVGGRPQYDEWFGTEISAEQGHRVSRNELRQICCSFANI